MKESTLLGYLKNNYPDFDISKELIELDSNSLEIKLNAILKYKSQVKGFLNGMFDLRKAINYNRKTGKENSLKSCEVLYKIK